MSDHHSMYYGYFAPGVYEYPVTHSALPMPSAYTWEPIFASGPQSNWCAVPVQNNATYVAGPFGGAVNYVSDVESHLALPNRYVLGVPLNSFCLALPPNEEVESESDPDQTRDAQPKSTVEITEVPVSKATQAKVIPKRKKRTHKRVYKAKQGYLVEEPTSELSDEDGAAP